jgi:hypothetical protein
MAAAEEVGVAGEMKNLEVAEVAGVVTYKAPSILAQGLF